MIIPIDKVVLFDIIVIDNRYIGFDIAGDQEALIETERRTYNEKNSASPLLPADGSVDVHYLDYPDLRGDPRAGRLVVGHLS